MKIELQYITHFTQTYWDICNLVNIHYPMPLGLGKDDTTLTDLSTEQWEIRH